MSSCRIKTILPCALIACLILSFVPFAPLSAQVPVKVNFVVRCPATSPADTVYITGNHPLLGNWDPGKVALEKTGISTWKQSFTFNQDTQLQYKFTRGSWDSEAIYVVGELPDDIKLTVRRDTTIYTVINNWRDKDSRLRNTGQVTGKVKVHNGIVGFDLPPRDVIVWLPPDYDKDSAIHYPVLYMHDGQNLFDPKTSAFGIDWQMDETADSLIKHDIIDPIIIVGIYNTKERSVEYMETEQGNRYMQLVTDIVKPLIDAQYRTKPQVEFTATGGSSAGGFIAFRLFWEYPHVFSKVACLSTPFKYSSEKYTIDYIDNITDEYGKQPATRIYIDHGDDELDSRLKPGIEDMVLILRNMQFTDNVELIYKPLTNSQHNEKSWARSVPRFLKYFYAK